MLLAMLCPVTAFRVEKVTGVAFEITAAKIDFRILPIYFANVSKIIMDLSFPNDQEKMSELCVACVEFVPHWDRPRNISSTISVYVSCALFVDDVGKG